MIGKVAGILDYRAADHVLVDAGGVGYVVYCAERTLASLPEPGRPVALFTELVVREDLLQLYGFPTLVEREWHRLLTTVQGVGAKAALAITGALGPEGVARAIALGDAAAIRRAPGVGPKLAERIVLELRNRAPALMAMGAAGAMPAAASTTPDPTGERHPAGAPGVRSVGSASGADPGAGAQATADALSALVNLGYGQGEAASAVAEAASEGPQTAGDLIRSALRRLAPKG